MKSGLEDRNNEARGSVCEHRRRLVSMKSGLEDRNNDMRESKGVVLNYGLNEVRPGRPEQSCRRFSRRECVSCCLNEVRPGRPEQYPRCASKAVSTRSSQ